MGLVANYEMIFNYTGLTNTFETVKQSIVDFDARVGKFVEKTIGNPNDWVSNYGQAMIEDAIANGSVKDRMIGDQIKWAGDAIQSGEVDWGSNPWDSYTPDEYAQSGFEFAGSQIGKLTAGAIAAAALSTIPGIAAQFFAGAVLSLSGVGEVVLATLLIGWAVDWAFKYEFGQLGGEVGAWLHDILHGINLASLLPVDPLVLDLNGDGIGLVGLVDGHSFDFSGDLFREKTGWVDGNDGILVVDHNLNGLIDDGYEMFGNFAVFDDATGGTVPNSNVAGFDQLATFDSNGDGRVDAGDAKFAEIKVWQDANHNDIVKFICSMRSSRFLQMEFSHATSRT